jgi:ketosteroid isomerase-like protein
VSTNSELLIAGYETWNRNDRDAWLDLLHPDVQIQTSGMFPDLASEFRGREGAVKFWRQLHEPWSEFRIDVEHVEDEEDYAIASIRFRARGVDSGVEVDMRFGMAMRVRDGLAIEFANRRNFAEARTAMRPAPAAERDRQSAR